MQVFPGGVWFETSNGDTYPGYAELWSPGRVSRRRPYWLRRLVAVVG